MSIKKEAVKICAIVSYEIYPAKMGGQKGIALFYSFFSKLLPVSIISTKNNGSPENLSAEFLPVLSTNKFRYINPFLLFRLGKIIKQKKITHLILEQPFYGWLGILAKSIFDIKLVIHSHNIEGLRFKSTGKWWWKILWYYEKISHRNADINFFISDEDRKYAVRHFKLNPEKCHTITYGFERKQEPDLSEKMKAKTRLQENYGLPVTKKLLLFNGTLNYKPNLDALDVILDQINPLLMSESNFDYTIIVCGKNLPESYNQLKEYQNKNIIYAGFVEDINIYFEGADIFINPVIDGGGIKTKLVEALGFDLLCISSKNGAIGVPLSVTGNQLKVVDNGDWKAFAAAIVQWQPEGKIGPAFFNHFYWGNIARKAADIINNNS